MKQGSARAAPRRLRSALRSYLERRQSDRPISIADMIRRTRIALPDIHLSDDELEQVIAREIVRCGGDIAFDRRNLDWLSAPNVSQALGRR
jgi:hypothetical protein